VAPAGYNKLTAPLTVVIDNEGKISGSDLSIEANVIKVENKTGATLPETGGIGTTIFYLVGGLMMAAAVVLLVAKKRTVNE
jgi:LPXTG-motif cell wall-anchored protein